MVVLNKIYTKTGDDGTTALGTGERVRKFDQRIEAYGTVDETNSIIGLATTQLNDGSEDNKTVLAMLSRIQNDLFDLGADLCTPDKGEKLDYEPLRIVETQVKRLENEIDELNKHLDPLRSFILPGGTTAGATLHIARTVSRRAERQMIKLKNQDNEQVGEFALHYINRLSDFLFVASRFVNDRGKMDVLWAPGQNR
ncbi:MAG: cob(I)yrinic acid a,c-diamide adenosyltransferase [Methyloligellaceae bacterium]